MAKERRVQFDDQLRRYFGSDDLEAIAPEALGAGIERMRVDLGLEQVRTVGAAKGRNRSRESCGSARRRVTN